LLERPGLGWDTVSRAKPLMGFGREKRESRREMLT